MSLTDEPDKRSADTPKPNGDEPAPGSKKRLLIELTIVFVISLVLTRAASDLARFVPLVAEHLFTIVAAVFLVLPWIVLTRHKASFEAHAMTWKGSVRGIGVALLLTVVTLVPFLAGFHVWRTVIGDAELKPSVDNYLRTGVETEGRPDLSSGSGEVLIWREHQDIQLMWRPPSGQRTIRVELWARNGTIEVINGRSFAEDPEVKRRGSPRARVVLTTVSGATIVKGTATIRVRGPGTLDIRVLDNGRLATAELLKVGPTRIPAPELDGFVASDNQLQLDRSLWWVPLVLIAQFLLVAFPEEFFYRGYLQTRLARVWGARWNILWVHVGPAIIITSLAFALGHFFVDVRPTRLAVFFPSLLFGWLRDRTGTIVAPITYHALCNLMVEAMAPHYD